MSYDAEQGRDDLDQFGTQQPDNYWDADPHARAVVARWAGQETYGRWAPDLLRFGALCAGPIDRAVRINNLGHNLPVLDRFSPFGQRVEEVEHHPSFHAAGALIYNSGVMRVLGTPGNNLYALALFYLSTQNGEAGHNCPLACTAGAIKSLSALGSAELKERYLSRLLETDYGRLAHGAQFLTEVQGGSDVGANSVRAVQEDAAAGTWRVHGEKWFCSNVTADVIVVTARPEGAAEGTRGLGLFIMPRRLPDGSLNSFTLRRLKDKVGTRTLPTAELDLDGALAWQLGPLEDGFRNMMTHVINTSRIFNGVGCGGMARRACVVAHGYARHRGAFGAPIHSYPMVQETLVDMRAETAAMVSGSLYLAHLLDQAERGEADANARAFLRTAINLNKTRSALSSHEVILSVEVLGGNGTIETFSVLPRLLRDNVVFENWEGSHNVLLLQVLRDCKRKGMHEPFFAHLATQAGAHGRLKQAITWISRDFAAALADEEAVATLKLRALGSRMAWLQWACAMIADGSAPELLEHFLDRRIGPAAVRNGAYVERLARLSAEP